MMAARVFGLLILLPPAVAFVGHSYTSTTCSCTGIGLQRLSLRSKSRTYPYPFYKYQNYHRLHVKPVDEDNKDELNIDKEAPPLPPLVTSEFKDGDPRQALEQFGSLFSQIQVIVTEGNSWTSDELEEKTKEFVRTYIRVFVPGLGYAATSLFVFVSTFLFLNVALAISGHGLADLLVAATDNHIDGVRDFLLTPAVEKWGNVAIALLGCELLSPLILATTLALTPKTMNLLRNQLEKWGWGENDIDRRASEILNQF